MSINVLLNYSNITESTLVQVKDDYINMHNQLVEQILKISDEELTWLNLVQPFIDLNNTYVSSAYLNMKDFYLDEGVRNKATFVQNELSKWSIEQSMRKDIWSKYRAYELGNWIEESKYMNQEAKSYFINMMLDYETKGMCLPEDQFNRLSEIKKEISDLTSKFSQNMGCENYSELVPEDKLDGLPKKYLDERRNESNLIKVTLKYPDYIPIMEYATNREIRKHFSTKFKSRCLNENIPIIEKVFKLRTEIASIFQKSNYSDYKLIRSMAGSTDTVNNFLSDLLSKVKPLLKTDLEALNKLAQADQINKLELWDVPYYSRIYIEQNCDFKKEELKKYFPVEKVISGALEIYQKLLGYKFERINDLNHTLWYETVELYQVIDSDTMKTIGYFYLDLYPREGKYSHAACFPFIDKSKETLPVATMGCNFNRGNLTFDEVETFFHEFGHVMHHLSSKSEISSTASFTCEHDFVETPSQMFEEWCYAKQTLQMMSQDLPDEMVDKLNLSRNMLQGYHYARQLLFGHFDMKIHSGLYEKLGLSPTELFNQIQKDVLEMDPVPETSEPASFGHLMHGYDSGYYGYLWSLVYAKDLFSKFANDKLLDSELGKKLRDEVLSQGSMRPSLVSIKNFLEREPSTDAFIKSII